MQAEGSAAAHESPIYWTERWRRFWKTPDPMLLTLGGKGELVVARVRLLVIGVLLSIPVRNLILNPGPRENYVGLSISLIALLIAFLIQMLVRRHFYRPSIGFLTSLFDVTLVSVALALFFCIDQPHTAVNSKVVFPVYVLALTGTCLRHDARISVLTGCAAIGQYAAITLYADTRWDLNDPKYAPFTMGVFSWDAQFGRLILLLAATVLTTIIVSRTQRLALLSKTDQLTGLINRAEFEERLRGEASRCERHGGVYTLAMIDIDRFKILNDSFGHESGDRALRFVAGTLRSSVRQSDIVARYGGDEFAVLFRQTTSLDVQRKLEQILLKLNSNPLVLNRHSALTTVTLSAGIAFGQKSAEAPDVINEADGRLYQAKQLGGNRVLGPEDSVFTHRE